MSIDEDSDDADYVKQGKGRQRKKKKQTLQTISIKNDRDSLNSNFPNSSGQKTLQQMKMSSSKEHATKRTQFSKDNQNNASKDTLLLRDSVDEDPDERPAKTSMRKNLLKFSPNSRKERNYQLPSSISQEKQISLQLKAVKEDK